MKPYTCKVCESTSTANGFSLPFHVYPRTSRTRSGISCPFNPGHNCLLSSPAICKIGFWWSSAPSWSTPVSFKFQVFKFHFGHDWWLFKQSIHDSLSINNNKIRVIEISVMKCHLALYPEMMLSRSRDGFEKLRWDGAELSLCWVDLETVSKNFIETVLSCVCVESISRRFRKTSLRRCSVYGFSLPFHVYPRTSRTRSGVSFPVNHPVNHSLLSPPAPISKIGFWMSSEPSSCLLWCELCIWQCEIWNVNYIWRERMMEGPEALPGAIDGWVLVSDWVPWHLVSFQWNPILFQWNPISFQWNLLKVWKQSADYPYGNRRYIQLYEEKTVWKSSSQGLRHGNPHRWEVSESLDQISCLYFWSDSVHIFRAPIGEQFLVFITLILR